MIRIPACSIRSAVWKMSAVLKCKSRGCANLLCIPRGLQAKPVAFAHKTRGVCPVNPWQFPCRRPVTAPYSRPERTEQDEDGVVVVVVFSSSFSSSTTTVVVFLSFFLFFFIYIGLVDVVFYMENIFKRFIINCFNGFVQRFSPSFLPVFCWFSAVFRWFSIIFRWKFAVFCWNLDRKSVV